MSPPRVAFAGTPAFAVPTLEALARSGCELVGVLTQPDRPKGRGQEISAGPVKRTALALGLPVSQPRSLRAAVDREALGQWRPELLVVVAYGLLLPAEVLSLPRAGCVNVHASLLPRWRGAAPVQRAILAGDAETGVTIMQMDVGLDTGGMLAQRRIPIGPQDTSATLLDRLAHLGAATLIEALPAVLDGTARAVPQPEQGVTYARKLEKTEAALDFAAPADAVARRIRGLDPWPVAQAAWNGEVIKLRGAAVLEEDRAGEPGRVRGFSGEALIVECGKGAVAIREWQRPGRRSLGAVEFAKGTAIIGQRLARAAAGLAAAT